MTKRELEVLYGYIFRTYTRLEQEMHQRQAQMRYTEVDTVQCFETACAIERFNMFCMVAHDIRYLLNLDKCEFEDVPDPRKPIFKED